MPATSLAAWMGELADTAAASVAASASSVAAVADGALVVFGEVAGVFAGFTATGVETCVESEEPGIVAVLAVVPAPKVFAGAPLLLPASVVPGKDEFPLPGPVASSPATSKSFLWISDLLVSADADATAFSCCPFDISGLAATVVVDKAA